MKLSLVSIDPAGFVRVASNGNITSSDLHLDQNNPMSSILGDNWRTHRVLLDLGKTDFIDSSAIGWLIETDKGFREGGGRLVVHSLTPRVRQVMDLLKIDRALNLATDEPSARQVLLGEAP